MRISSIPFLNRTSRLLLAGRRAHDALLGRLARLQVPQLEEEPALINKAYGVYDGVDIEIPGMSDEEYVTWEEPEGLDLHGGGYGSRGGHKPRIIVLHWGGYNPAHCRRVLAARGYASHLGVGRGRAFQWLDFRYSAWHAGYVNKYAIGIDICASPMPNLLDRQLAQGYEIAAMENPSDRGPDVCLSLDPVMARTTHKLVKALCAAFDIPFHCPRGEGGFLGTRPEAPRYDGVVPKAVLNDPCTSGVIGHHHIKSVKWDIAPWWDQIFDGTDLA